MKLAQTFGRSVRHVRTRKGMSIEELAHEAGLSYSYVGELERGRRNPTLHVVETISSVLQVLPVELLVQSNRNSR